MVDITPTAFSAYTSTGLVKRLAGLSYGVLAFVVFAGTRPFQGAQGNALGLEGQGSSLEALLYLVTTLVCILCAVWLRGSRVFEALMAAMILVVAYCGLTLIWSATPMAGIVRWGQLALVTVAVGATVGALGAKDVFQITYRVLVVLLMLNFAAVMLVPGAIHAIGEPGTFPSHITSWKGVHIHKNYAGPVAALTVMMAVILVLAGRWWHAAVALAALIFLVETNSSTSQLAMAAALSVMCVMKAVASQFGRGAARLFLCIALVGAAATIATLQDRFASLMNDPYALTGRVELWHVLWHYIEAYPWTGSGYGSFWRLGDQSPILALTDGWPIFTGQGHNGYLDLAVTIGVPGLLLTVFVFGAMPLYTALKRATGASSRYDLCISAMIFAWVHNLAETSLLAGNHPVYFTLLLGIFGLTELGRTGDRAAT